MSLEFPVCKCDRSIRSQVLDPDTSADPAQDEALSQHLDQLEQFRSDVATWDASIYPLINTYGICSRCQSDINSGTPRFIGFTWAQFQRPSTRELRSRLACFVVSELAHACKPADESQFQVLNMFMESGFLTMIIKITGMTNCGPVSAGSLILYHHIVHSKALREKQPHPTMYFHDSAQMIRNPCSADIVRRPYPRILILHGGSKDPGDGLVTLKILFYLELALKTQSGIHDLALSDVFDWIVGTSYSAIIAVGLKRGMDVNHVRRQYQYIEPVLRPDYFSWLRRMFYSVWTHWDGRSSVERVLQDSFDGDNTLGNLRQHVGLVTRHFNNSRKLYLITSENNPDMTVTEAIRRAIPSHNGRISNIDDRLDDKFDEDPNQFFLRHMKFPPTGRQGPVTVSVGTGKSDGPEAESGTDMRTNDVIGGTYFQLNPVMPENCNWDIGYIYQCNQMKRFPDNWPTSFESMVQIVNTLLAPDDSF